MIEYIQGDATEPQGDGPKVLVHLCNDLGRWGKGFVVALANRWPASRQAYLDWAYGRIHHPFRVGEVQFVKVAEQLWVANVIALRGIAERIGDRPIRYDAVQTGLTKVGQFATHKGASIHMPLIGTGLAGGSWVVIKNIIDLVLRDHNVFVYSLGDERLFK